MKNVYLFWSGALSAIGSEFVIKEIMGINQYLKYIITSWSQYNELIAITMIAFSLFLYLIGSKIK